jgi:hypothetical protein
MQTPRFFRLAAFYIALSTAFWACKTNTLHSQKQEYNPKNYSLQDWKGTYKGQMYIYNVKAPDTPMSVDIMLEIYPTATADRWIWRTSYDSKQYGKSVKDYTLVKPDSLLQAYYWIDEGNEVLIHHTYLNNVFYCNFKAGDMFIQSRTELLPSQQILIEIVAQPEYVIYSLKANDSTDFLKSYPTTTIQKAILNKTAIKQK